MEKYGRIGYAILPLLALIAFVGGWQWLSNQYSVPSNQYSVSTAQHAIHNTPATPFTLHPLSLILFLIITLQSTIAITPMIFVPKLFTELGYTTSYAGWGGGMFRLGTVIGGIVGGILADRISGKRVIALSMVGAILPLYWFIPANGAAQLLWLLLAGAFAGMPHTVLVLQVQSLFPRRQAMASGLALGFMFFTGAVGGYVMGLIADEIGLGVALQGTAVLPFIALLMIPFLPTHITGKQ